MNKVLPFPASTTLTPYQALDSARQLAPTDVCVVGYDVDGDFFVRSSRMDRMDALWLAELLREYARNP
jgi:hypothetical protein